MSVFMPYRPHKPRFLLFGSTRLPIQLPVRSLPSKNMILGLSRHVAGSFSFQSADAELSFGDQLARVLLFEIGLVLNRTMRLKVLHAGVLSSRRTGRVTFVVLMTMARSRMKSYVASKGMFARDFRCQ